jgi:phosphate transport system permease protein
MSFFVLTVSLLILSTFAYWMGKKRAFAVSGGKTRDLHSLPGYYGAYVAFWFLLPALIVFAIWSLFESSVISALLVPSLPASVQAGTPGQIDLALGEIYNLQSSAFAQKSAAPEKLALLQRLNELESIGLGSMIALAFAAGAAGMYHARRRIVVRLRARQRVEKVVNIVMVVCSAIAILTTIGIVLSLLFETIRFFNQVSPAEFLFGLQWSPQTALRADQVGASGAFGAVPIFAGTLLITVIAMVVAVPIGLMSAIYMAEYSTPRFRGWVKPILEILAGIPTVVYGFFAALTIAPMIRGFGESFGLTVASESALAAGLVMGVMIIPFVSSLSDDVINAVPQSLRDGAYAMGATKSETIKQVVLPAALHGIVGSILLAVSRAIGETMIVVMAAGLSANLTANPFEAVTTVTVQIVTLLVGDQEFDSPKTLAAFALGFVLFIVTLCLNMIALAVVRKYREKYE